MSTPVTATSLLRCAGCGTVVEDGAAAFRCPAGGDDADHVVARVLHLGDLRFPVGGPVNPFLRYRELLHAYHCWCAAGRSDAEFLTLVEELDAAVAEVDGRGFEVTRFERDSGLSGCLGFVAHGGVWVKNETVNVSGSHKARHLMGVAIYLEVLERLGRIPARDKAPKLAPAARQGGPTLAIASCGNAALAAAVVAAAARRPLQVFVPPDAEAPVLARLGALGAEIVTCPREGDRPGDPCVHGFRRAVAEGAIPFGCQGSENGLAVEGGYTLGWEIASAFAGGGRLDRLVVQVGGGALASGLIQSLREAVTLGALPEMPRVHAVQTNAVAPLARAYEGVVGRIVPMLPAHTGGQDAHEEMVRADWIEHHADEAPVREALRYARAHRPEFMWPWEKVGPSVARGILDDETYDWFEIVAGMVETAGWPVTVGEERLREANRMAHEATGITVCATGSAGLAGLMELLRCEAVDREERVAVVFTGVER